MSVGKPTFQTCQWMKVESLSLNHLQLTVRKRGNTPALEIILKVMAALAHSIVATGGHMILVTVRLPIAWFESCGR
jgi:F0F1-type ATP synthase membrane subunit a